MNGLLKMYNPERNEEIEILVSEEDAEKAQRDMLFATQLLQAEYARRQEVVEAEGVQPIPENQGQEEPEVVEDLGSCLLKWTEPAVLLLLDTYRNLEYKLSTQSHKKSWEDISHEIAKKGHKFTGPQAASKLRRLKKTYKNVKDHNTKSGNDRRTWPYFEIMDDIFKAKAWVAPVAVASSSGLSEKQDEAPVEKPDTKSTIVSLLKKTFKAEGGA